MKIKAVPAFTLAAACFALPVVTLAQAGQTATAVPAQVTLKANLDAKKAQPGSTFQTTLVSKVHLANGPDLPAGTVLVGQVVEDDMQVAGTTKLAIRFTAANLKNGQTIPIKATIVRVTNPDDVTGQGFAPSEGAAWDANLKVDQNNVNSGVDFHSAASSTNSGVFVATKAKAVQLRAGSEFNLALSAAGQPSANTTGH